MNTPSVRMIPIDDLWCPVCSEMSGDDMKGYSRTRDQVTGIFGPIVWFKFTCTNCRSIVDRHLIGPGVVTEEISLSRFGEIFMKQQMESKS
jgi:hypothetical protein